MDDTCEWVRGLIKKDELWKFYKGKAWLKLKAEVLEDNHYECRICKEKGRITRYETGKDGERRLLSTVHHVNEVRSNPELALSRYYLDRWGLQRENLIPICKACHNAVHNRTFTGKERKGEVFTTPERW